ncbi:adenylate/guanylate cyclase domain-containing protein [Rhizobacter sp. J219]|jgi:adenylate cyclase|uniref:adenylate/guanylate cyclase domain-containing protein n=1 Tax=Rhizobacter sp. J219 TaxID=2898430 RepID=UPI0021516C8B|nr:adenylate/guanylate cyclase domain-containing protein [Rhizobacter sp. J219]MCR5882019.1 adenylate/guanylate cyclase domain-containing protein [Rhizobacter sp. J219]
MTQILQRTVLFADLRGSTALYETLGNTEATTVVTRSVSLIAQIVSTSGGVVVKTLGDGLMAVFADSTAAVVAADEMHESLERIVPPSGQRNVPVLKLQVGLAHGEVVEMSGDCFGDAVNVAARLLDHAGDNETLATASVVAGLASDLRERCRSLDKVQLRGRVEPVHVYLIEGRRFGDTAATAYGELLPQAEPEGIRLVWLDLNRVYAGPSLPVVLGRSPQVTYCIDDSRVSRSHARIDWHGGAFQLTDLSYNGTYVRFSNGAEIVALRRGTCTLHGSGLIGLGATLTDPTAPCVRFEILKFADTQPQDAL